MGKHAYRGLGVSLDRTLGMILRKSLSNAVANLSKAVGNGQWTTECVLAMQQINRYGQSR